MTVSTDRLGREIVAKEKHEVRARGRIRGVPFGGTNRRREDEEAGKWSKEEDRSVHRQKGRPGAMANAGRCKPIIGGKVPSRNRPTFT